MLSHSTQHALFTPAATVPPQTLESAIGAVRQCFCNAYTSDYRSTEPSFSAKHTIRNFKKMQYAPCGG